MLFSDGLAHASAQETAHVPIGIFVEYLRVSRKHTNFAGFGAHNHLRVTSDPGIRFGPDTTGVQFLGSGSFKFEGLPFSGENLFCAVCCERRTDSYVPKRFPCSLV